MKIESTLLPSSDRPLTAMIRFIPENGNDDTQISSLKFALSDTDAIAATPVIDGNRCLTLVFHYAKKNPQT